MTNEIKIDALLAIDSDMRGKKNTKTKTQTLSKEIFAMVVNSQKN